MTPDVETGSHSERGLPPPKERRRLRESGELTHEQVASELGVTAGTVRSWETGRTEPGARSREAYADLLDRLARAGASRPAAGPNTRPRRAAKRAPKPPSAPPRHSPAHPAGAPAADTLRAHPTDPPPPPAPPTTTPRTHPTDPPPPPAPAADTPQTHLTADTPSAPAAHRPVTPPEPPAPSWALRDAPAPPPAPDPPAHPPADPAPAAADAPEQRAAAGDGAHAAPPPEPAHPPGGVRRPARPAEAFDALYGYSAPSLVRQVYLLTGRRGLAQESVERAFRQAWAQWPEVATDPDPVGWVRAAAYEYALSPWRRLRRAHRTLGRPDKAPADPNDRILLGALLALPPAHRRTVLLYDGVGLDLPDTAAETEASTPTTGNRLLHAHADLAARLPGLAGVPPEQQSAVLRAWLGAVRPAVPLDPPPAASVRTVSELRARRWARAALVLTAVIAVATGYTTVTAPDHYVAPVAPGTGVSGVPALAGPPRVTETSRALQDKLRADPAAGPHRIHPSLE
ncbi:helix-turn-helix domain-containing protein [Streptomyces sp. NPDC089915]|uniref:helix-turn-helix domain-containing protein n=1 Tax=Streptomyces sp. NPDC089915 TaxID=3155186 RepID=UPI003417334C